MEILLERSQESDFGFTLGKENDGIVHTANDSQWEDRYRGHVVTSIKTGGAAQRLLATLWKGNCCFSEE